MDFVRASMEVVSDTELGEVTYAVSYLQLDDNVLQDFDATPGFAKGLTLGLHCKKSAFFSVFARN